MQIPRLCPDARKLWGWSPEIQLQTSPPGDSEATSLVTTVLAGMADKAGFQKGWSSRMFRELANWFFLKPK